VIAHNMRAFDGCFLLQYLAENNLKPFPIFSGLKITCLAVKEFKIKIIDSLNFLPMPLSQFAEAFGFDDGSVKGYFPHFFTRSSNFDYKGILPPPQDYGIDTMSHKARQKFMNWYDMRRTNPDDLFNFEKENA